MEKFAGAPSFEIVVDRRSDVLVVGLAGELDFACAGALGELVAVELSPLDRDVVFDLARLHFIDLAGARLVGAAAGAVARCGWRCTVTSPSPLVAWVIEYAGLAELLGGAPKAGERLRRDASVLGVSAGNSTNSPLQQAQADVPWDQRFSIPLENKGGVLLR